MTELGPSSKCFWDAKNMEMQGGSPGNDTEALYLT